MDRRKTGLRTALAEATKLPTLPKPPRKAEPPPLRYLGPNWLRKPAVRVVGPGEPPPGFLTPWNSRSEWMAYWAFWQVLHEQGDVRKPPFIGGEHFGYQTVLEGGRSSLGGQLIDFVVWLPGEDVGFYLQSDRFHLDAPGGSIQHAIDLAKMLAASRYMTIKPLYEADIIRDPTGEAACRTIVETLGGRRRINPITSGTYTPSRAGRLFGGSRS